MKNLFCFLLILIMIGCATVNYNPKVFRVCKGFYFIEKKYDMSDETFIMWITDYMYKNKRCWGLDVEWVKNEKGYIIGAIIR